MVDSSKIPEPRYACKHCAAEHTWPANYLWWSELDNAFVCDICWYNRDLAWIGEECIDEDRGISLEAYLRIHSVEPITINIFGFHFGWDAPGTVDRCATWVIVHKCWMYGPHRSFWFCVKEMITGWKADHNLVG